MIRQTGRIIAACLLAAVLAACGSSRADKVETPSGMNIQRGRNYREVIEDFEDKGFTNIRTEKIEDLAFGWVVKNGEVEEISVGGDTNYDAGVWVPSDTEVVIRYHTFNTSDPLQEENSAEGAVTGEDPAGQTADDPAAAGTAEEPSDPGPSRDPAQAGSTETPAAAEATGTAP